VSQQIHRFGMGQTAKVVGVMFAPKETGLGTGFALALPMLYGVAWFIFTVIGCAIYNLVAGWVGGVEVELEGS